MPLDFDSYTHLTFDCYGTLMTERYRLYSYGDAMAIV